MKTLKLILLALLLVCSSMLTAQTKVLDSLTDLLAKADTAKDKAGLMNLIASEYTGNDPDKIKYYAEKALAIAKKNNIRAEEANALLNLGNVSIMMSNYPQAVNRFTQAQDILEKMLTETEHASDANIKNTLASIYGSLGVVFSEQNNYARALEYYFKALKLYKADKQEYIEAALYNNIGVVYKSHEEYDKALTYFEKALALQQKLKDRFSSSTMANIGNVYLEKGQYDKALNYYNDALSMLTKYEDNRALAELYNNFGDYYSKTGNINKAEENYKKALAIFNEAGEKFGASASLNLLGELYLKKKNDKQALDYFGKSSAYAQEIGSLEHVRDSEKSISSLYEKQGNYKEALVHYKKYTAAQDSIINAENIRTMVREEMNYEMERREALQKKENEKREAIYIEQEKRHRQQMIFAGLIVALLVGLVFVIYNRLQLKKTLTLQRDLAEYEQKALHLQMNPHFVFNCLGSISSFIVQNGTDSAIKYLSKFSKLMRLTLEYSKESLIPIDSEIEGLQNYLELEQLRFNRMFEFTITKDPDIEDDMAIPPLLLQPFVENAIIHGIIPKKEKGTIMVDFRLVNNKLVCTVTDDGIGFSKSKEMKEKSVTVHKSMALEITRKRLEVIQAFTSKTSQVEITELHNAAGEPAGTKIVLNLPIQYASN